MESTFSGLAQDFESVGDSLCGADTGMTFSNQQPGQPSRDLGRVKGRSVATLDPTGGSRLNQDCCWLKKLVERGARLHTFLDTTVSNRPRQTGLEPFASPRLSRNLNELSLHHTDHR